MPLKIIVNRPAPVKISQPVAANSAANPLDVLQIKHALNRFGYYTPPKNIGITDIPDAGLFSAIKFFQKALGLAVTGIINPDDDTLNTLNTELEKPKTGYYIWHTVSDSHVRSTHKELEGTIRPWNTSPTPGEDFGCRCWAEAVPIDIPPIYDPPIEPVYPELLLIPLLRVGRIYSLWKAWAAHKNTEWTLGKFKSDTKWGNQLRNRNWTPEQITETIQQGTKFPAPNKVNPLNTATRYEYKDRFVVRDDKTKEILQISGKEFVKNLIK